ncbi:unnamed protein product [Candidula unifasciata]|uniref:Fe2OG dioxygenase domain-containing protein n=1 Tax=Candidula unifasciata TaxID=100452 RepID=A0A8S3ZU55_9EUPU|nr:unnamed protein product [Candidula unifasciata]
MISISPYVTLFYDVITDQEIEALKAAAQNKLQRGTIVSSGTLHIHNYRTSHVALFQNWDSPEIMGPLTLRVAAITNLNTETYVPGSAFSAEQFQVASYGTGGQYGLHYDFLGKEVLHERMRTEAFSMFGGDRLATFLIYLTDVERGGSTVFPKLDVALSPVKKMAVFWYNAKPSGELDQLTVHGGCPIVVGNKWVSNKWMWNYGNTFTRRCGLTPKATQLDIEPYMRKGWV